MKKDMKTEIINMIVAKIESGERLPWSSGLLNRPFMPINSKTGRKYRGFNLMLLSYLGEGTLEFMTFNQVKEAGGKVKKGAESLPVIFWSEWNKAEKRPAQDGDREEDVYGFWKKYNVFNVGEQTEGINPRREIKTNDDNRKDGQAEAFINAFATATGLTIREASSVKIGNGSAYYSPAEHLVQIAPVNEYASAEQWTATIFHELVHSTGKAMSREKNRDGFGSELYSKEEIVAEFGAALLCRRFGIRKEDDNTAAYIKGWSEAIRNNPDWLINGANAAQKAVDYMLKVAGMEEPEDAAA